MSQSLLNVERLAAETLVSAFGAGDYKTAVAPGRITLVGEHVDYVGGKIACMAIDLYVGAALRAQSGGWKAASGHRRVERSSPVAAHDIGDRVFAACQAAREAGVTLTGVEVGVGAGLPEGAGLSSSAAITCAVLTACFRQAKVCVTADRMVELAIRAEREIAGIPCGDMDQWAVVKSADHQVMIFDAGRREASFVAWPWLNISLVVVDSSEKHDVGGRGYRERRAQAETVLKQLDVATAQGIGDRWQELYDETLMRRARHLSTETKRVEQSVAALQSGNRVELGQIISASHASLAVDYDASTEIVNRIVAAAQSCEGCYGARMVGGGFGGSVMAMCDEKSADSTRRHMVQSAGRSGTNRSWVVQPSAGIAQLAPDVIKKMAC